MTCTIVSTIGSALANSYLTIAEADAILSGRLYADAWLSKPDAVKCKALQMATALLDAHVRWNGYAATTAQALGWPRNSTLDQSGYGILTTVIPMPVKRATAELARLLTISDRTEENSVKAEGIKRLKAGPLDLEFDTVGGGIETVPDSVLIYVRHLGKRATAKESRSISDVVRT